MFCEGDGKVTFTRAFLLWGNVAFDEQVIVLERYCRGDVSYTFFLKIVLIISIIFDGQYTLIHSMYKTGEQLIASVLNLLFHIYIYIYIDSISLCFQSSSVNICLNSNNVSACCSLRGNCFHRLQPRTYRL